MIIVACWWLGIPESYVELMNSHNHIGLGGFCPTETTKLIPVPSPGSHGAAYCTMNWWSVNRTAKRHSTSQFTCFSCNVEWFIRCNSRNNALTCKYFKGVYMSSSGSTIFFCPIFPRAKPNLQLNFSLHPLFYSFFGVDGQVLCA